LAVGIVEGQVRLQVRDNGHGLPVDVNLGNAKSVGLRTAYILSRRIAATANVANQNGTSSPSRSTRKNLWSRSRSRQPPPGCPLRLFSIDAAPPEPTLLKRSDIVCTLFRCSSGSFPSRSIHPDSWSAAPELYQQIWERLTGAACSRFPESRSSRRPSVASHSPALIGSFISGADRHLSRR